MQDSTGLKNCNFLNCANIALTISCEHWLESPSNWVTQKTQKVSDFCRISVFEFRQEQKRLFLMLYKNNKNHVFAFSFFYWNQQQQQQQTQKSTFKAKLSTSPSLQVIFFALIHCLGLATAWCNILALPRFSTSWLHWMLGNSENFWQCSFLTHKLHIFTKSTATPTYHRNFTLMLCSSVVATSKICRSRSRNSSVVKSQGYFVSEQPFFQFHEQQGKFANEVHHLTRFIEKVDA